jgi:hypothetical protein
VRRRELEPIRLPNGFRFKRQDVERYLAERADPD